MRLTWADYKMTTTGTAVLFPDLHIKQTKPTKKRQKIQKFAKNVSYWARNGGGHLGVTVFATGGGGGGDTKKFFEKAIVFGVFHRSCQNAKNYQLFEKIFRVPPSPPPPPRCEQ